MPKTDYRPDFRLDGFESATDTVEEAFWAHIDSDHDSMSTLAAHHSPDGRHSFYVIHNGAVTWGIPGEPRLVALHLIRDLTTSTYDFEQATLPLPAMAQSWLIKRGCPAEAIALPPEMGTKPADETTVALQQRLMGAGDHFALLYSYTDDTSSTSETTVLLRAVDERVERPFRVLLERADLDTYTHTLREGTFETFEAATSWMDDRSSPLPPATPATVRTAGPAAGAVTPPKVSGRSR
ncbi:hypothetical protein ACFVRB_27010 [Streptomyces nojiriensis]|uniref:hypothetical protein n=1 Tax=Streptomyces nojiriensis TaxID=66374 RepID=UPI0036D98B58